MTSHTPHHPNPAHAAPDSGTPAPPRAEKERVKSDQQHELARRKALVESRHKENVHSDKRPAHGFPLLAAPPDSVTSWKNIELQ
jgi:hypothetical protein